MTTEQKNKILENAYIPQEWWENCFITEDEMIFTPLFDEEGVVTKTGEQVHAEWLANKDKPVEPEITDKEKIQALEEQVVVLNDELTSTNLYMTDLELELMTLKATLNPEQ